MLHTSTRRSRLPRELALEAVTEPANAEVVGSLVDFMGTLARSRALQGESASVTSALLQLAADGPMHSSTLSKHLGLDQSTVSRQVCAMADEGLIERNPDPADKRAQHIQLSDAGHARLQERVAHRVKTLEIAVQDWSDRDRNDFTRLLTMFVSDFGNALTNQDTSTAQPRSNKEQQ
jgi:DNA-binding MarR family transcriptional regulator